MIGTRNAIQLLQVLHSKIPPNYEGKDWRGISDTGYFIFPETKYLLASSVDNELKLDTTGTHGNEWF